jgi:RNA polymerase sigma-70 factor (sigma-E family)
VDTESESQFREFVEARSLALRRTAYALTGDLHRAEDLVQGALIKLAGRWHKIDDPEAYVRRIIYHDHASWWRRRSSREISVPETPDRTDGDAAERVDRRLDLQRALLRLTPRQRAVILLRFYDDLHEREIADILGCSVGTVRSQTSRALAKLRRVAPELDPSPAVPLSTSPRKAPA